MLVKIIAILLAILPEVMFIALSLNSAKHMHLNDWIVKVKSMFVILLFIILSQVGAILLFK